MDSRDDEYAEGNEPNGLNAYQGEKLEQAKPRARIFCAYCMHLSQFGVRYRLHFIEIP